MQNLTPCYHPQGLIPTQDPHCSLLWPCGLYLSLASYLYSPHSKDYLVSSDFFPFPGNNELTRCSESQMILTKFPQVSYHHLPAWGPAWDQNSKPSLFQYFYSTVSGLPPTKDWNVRSPRQGPQNGRADVNILRCWSRSYNGLAFSRRLAFAEKQKPEVFSNP